MNKVIEDNTKILYRHIRLDTNEVFYIGIGDIKRANDKTSRSKYWRSITNKTKYRIDIILENLTWDDACKKEIEFIKLYGRKDLGLGTLVNMTDGGEGRIHWSEEQTLLHRVKSQELFASYSEEKKLKWRTNISIKVRLAKSNRTETQCIDDNKKVSDGWNKRTLDQQKQYKEFSKLRKIEWWELQSEDIKNAMAIKISNTLKGKYSGIPKPQKYVTCPYCNKLGGQSNMTRYHFNNCKKYEK